MREATQGSTRFARRLRRQMSRAETILWNHLRNRRLLGQKFRRQVPIGPYVADFACTRERLIVEVDGATHWLPHQVEHDQRRTAFLEACGWRIIRVTNLDIYDRLDDVRMFIASALEGESRRGAPPVRSTDRD